MAEAGLLCGMLLLVLSATFTALSILFLIQAMQVVYYTNKPVTPITTTTTTTTMSTVDRTIRNNSNTNDTPNTTTVLCEEQREQEQQERVVISYTKAKTYEDLVELVLGKVARRVVEASMLFFCCGTAVAYIIAVGDILEQSGWTSFSFQHHHHHHHDSSNDDNNNISHRTLAMTLVWLIAMVPLSLQRTMKSLQCASSIGIASILTLVLAAFYHYVDDLYHHHENEYHFHHQHDDQNIISTFILSSMGNSINNDNSNSSSTNSTGGNDDSSQSIWEPTQGILSILRACPIIIFAFSCQVNVCAIYDEMPGRYSTMQEQTAVAARTRTTNESDENDADADADDDVIATVSDSNDEESPSTAITERAHNLHSTDASTSNPHPTSPLSTPTSPSMTLSKHSRMIMVTCLAVGICALLYTSISVIALLDFGSNNTTPNILSSYDPRSVMQVAFVGMALAVVLAYPMNIFPARVTLLGIARSFRKQESNEDQVPSSDNDLTEPLLVPLPEDATTNIDVSTGAAAAAAAAAATALSHQSGNSENNDSLWEHIVATMFLTGLSLALAIVTPDISVVFGLLGGTSSSILGFIIPGMLGYKTAEDYCQGEATAGAAAQRLRFLSMVLVVAGILLGVVCTAVTVYSTFAIKP